MTPKLHVVLTDDWELRGNGEGDMRQLQFATARTLSSLYEDYGWRGSFLVEVMQQQMHLSLARSEPAVAVLAEEWERTVTNLLARGHDIQLHVHPQWRDASYTGGRWNLPSHWSLCDLPESELLGMLGNCKNYLERLLQQVTPSYRCVAFRASYWIAAPSEFLFSVLVKIGIRLDVSMLGGMQMDKVVCGHRLRFDYRDLEEPLLPYYPCMKDARRIGPPGSLVCVPTTTFSLGSWRRFQQRVARCLGPADRHRNARAGRLERAPNQAHQGERRQGATRFEYLLRSLRPICCAADLSAMSPWQFAFMLAQVRERASESRAAIVPVILANHTKDVADFEPVRSCLRQLANAADVEVITLAELLGNIEAGLYPVRQEPSHPRR